MSDTSSPDPTGRRSEPTDPGSAATQDSTAAEGAGRLIGGRYRLGPRIGGGAMGVVWSGTDELLRRPVAVKEVLLPPGLPDREADELQERTLREARAIAVVSHPNVLVLYDVARENSVPFVVMEMLPSQSLATVLREHGALDETQLATIADSVAAALQAAHRGGIIHRDVKPGNVLISDDGRIKLSDFGISRNVADSTITRTGIMLGTPAFLAPEVATGDQLTEAADRWGLGATLFAAAEGHPPYDTDDDPLTTVTAIVHDPVPATTYPGPVGEVISGLLAKDPAARMPLDEVRRRLGPLLPPDETRPFALMRTQEPMTPGAPVAVPGRGEGRKQDPEPREAEPVPLAADPGPLPFEPRAPTRGRGRQVLAVIATALAALLLFTAAAVGGFAASRTLAGEPLLPTPPPAPAPPPPPEVRLAPVTETARHESDSDAGTFTARVPEGWTQFKGQRDDAPADSMTVHFVSPDGREEIAVERFGGYFTDGYDIDDYRDVLQERAAGANGDVEVISDAAVGDADPTSGENEHRVVFETVQRALGQDSNAELRRLTSLQLIPRDGDLWTIRLTVPADSADADGRAPDLFGAVVDSFEPQS
ncbi:serine/threonine-protein kinase [Allosaccharopolyspora coralli]|nr:serine/threonine-protein kinase [Allosaccharopolyspora coralli]